MSLPIGTTPDPAPVAPTAPPQADPALVEQVQQQLLNDIFGGKYKNPTEAKKGYWEGVKYNSQLESLIANGPAPTALAPPDPFKRIAEESLVPADALMQAIKQVVGSEMQSVFGPISGALQARTQLVAQTPRYAEDEAKVLAFADQHPELSQKVQAMSAAGFPLEALKLQYAEFLQSHPPSSQPPADLRAGLPGTPGSDPNRNPGAQQALEQDAARLKAAVQHALVTKDENPLWNEVYKDFTPKLPPGFLPSNG